MNLLERFEHWGDAHHPKWMDIVRIALGMFLIYKGVDFAMNMSAITGPLSNKTSFGDFSVILMGHYVVFAHLLGGILIIAGFLTRFACLIQIPILIGAVFFINSASDVFRPYSEAFLSIIVLLLLIYFLIVGDGPWAVKLKEEEERRPINA